MVVVGGGGVGGGWGDYAREGAFFLYFNFMIVVFSEYLHVSFFLFL